MKLVPIVAYGTNRIIGKDGHLPDWALSKDMQFFKKIRGNFPLFMGRKTYESFRRPNGILKPLPGADHFILTRNDQYKPEGDNGRVFITDSLAHAIGDAFALGYDKMLVIGGSDIYREAFSQTNFPVEEFYATEIEDEFEGDTFFPALDYSKWKREVLEEVFADESNSHNFKIVHYTKLAA